MFCPKCGKADQSPETFCRQCGVFLPDLEKPGKQPIRPEEHVTANLVLSAMTIVASLILAVLLYLRFGYRENTPALIYLTIGILIAIGAWHIQAVWRSLMLKKHFKKNKRSEPPELDGKSEIINAKSLAQPDLEHFVPASVTDRTTKHLSETKLKSSKPKH